MVGREDAEMLGSSCSTDLMRSTNGLMMCQTIEKKKASVSDCMALIAWFTDEPIVDVLTPSLIEWNANTRLWCPSARRAFGASGPLLSSGDAYEFSAVVQ
ncbi:uncharacterized [Tachysurus ichikawai]